MREIDTAAAVWGGKANNEALLMFHLGKLDEIPIAVTSEDDDIGEEVGTYSWAELSERFSNNPVMEGED